MQGVRGSLTLPGSTASALDAHEKGAAAYKGRHGIQQGDTLNMARGRFISKSLSTSEKFAKLKTDGARLLYCMVYPHIDDFGRYDGSEYNMKIACVPTCKMRTCEIAKYLDDLEYVGLIKRWDAEGKKVIKFIDFDKHQTNLQRRTRTYYPDPPKQIHRNSVKFSEIQPLVEVKDQVKEEVEVKGFNVSSKNLKEQDMPEPGTAQKHLKKLSDKLKKGKSTNDD